MMKIFSLFAVPLGYVMRWIYGLVPSYFVAMFLFTLLLRVLLFPIGIKTQKGQADRARLAPRLERIQKKYANDRQKLQEKQQELYQKEGVSLTGGCLPMIIQMLVLFSVIAVIYKPLTYVQRMDTATITACTTVVEQQLVEDQQLDETEAKKLNTRFSESSYYNELYLLKYSDEYQTEITDALVSSGKTAEDAAATVQQMEKTKSEFSIFGVSLLGVPTDTGIRPNWLWLIAILSGASALLSSMISMKFSNMTMPADQQQAAGCMNKSMMYMMPLMSLVFSFTVPAGVAVYWIFSNLLALVQSVILNKMYNPAKIRAEAEAEYAERRRKKAEDRERLKAARLEEQAAWQKAENEDKAAKTGKTGKPAKTPEATQTTAEEPSSENDGKDGSEQ